MQADKLSVELTQVGAKASRAARLNLLGGWEKGGGGGCAGGLSAGR